MGLGHVVDHPGLLFRDFGGGTQRVNAQRPSWGDGVGAGRGGEEEGVAAHGFAGRASEGTESDHWLG